MIRYLLLLICSHCVGTCLWAQSTVNFNADYEPIKFEGIVPSVFLENTLEQTLAEIDNRDKDQLSKKQSKSFYTLSNYALNGAFRSGNVYFNDPMTDYVRQVASKALSGHPELLKAVDIYVTKFTVPNASAWRTGTIFFNIGLLQLLENEAQLAFVICHEAAHVAEKHSLQSYKKQEEIEEKGSVFARASEMERFFEQLRYSRQYEFEADEKGMALFLQSGYDTQAPNQVMDILKKADIIQRELLPLDEIFNDEGLEQKEEGSCDWTIGRQGKEEEDDKYSTHPATDKRKEAITNLLAKASRGGGKPSLIATVDFDYIQQLAHFEVIEKWLKTGDYGRSLYEALVLQQQYPNNQYLHEVIASSLYWIAYYARLGSLDNLLPGKMAFERHPYGHLLCFLEGRKTSEYERIAISYLDTHSPAFPDSDILALLALKVADWKDEKADYGSFIKRFPDSPHCNFAKRQLKK
jgi:Zn-dependent protease with chaperone function